jgi:hypothetical protein
MYSSQVVFSIEEVLRKVKSDSQVVFSIEEGLGKVNSD